MPLSWRTQPHCVGVLLVVVAIGLVAKTSVAHDALTEQIARLTAEIGRNPTNGELLVRRGDLYRARRQWTEALADFDRALRLDPTRVTAELGRARVLFETGQPTGAIQAADRFLQRVPGHFDALVLRARARLAVGRTGEAIADYTRALDGRANPDLYIELARTMRRSSRYGAGDALRTLDAGIRRLGSIVTLEMEAIEIERDLKRYDAALLRLARVSAQAQRHDTWLARRGEILEQAGRLDEARETYRAALIVATSGPSMRQSRASRLLADELRANLARLDNDATSHARKRDQ